MIYLPSSCHHRKNKKAVQAHTVLDRKESSPFQDNGSERMTAEADSRNGSAPLGGGVDDSYLHALGGVVVNITEGMRYVEGSIAVVVGGKLEGGAAFVFL